MGGSRGAAWQVGITFALVLTCTGCARGDLINAPTAASGSSAAAASPSVPERDELLTVPEYLATQGIDVSGHPDFVGKGPADQYAGTYLMATDGRTSGVWARFFADYLGPIDTLRCDPVCSQGPTTVRVDGATPQDSWRQTMVVHGPDANQGVEGLRVIDRTYGDGVRVVLEIPPWEGQRTPSLDLEQAEALLESALGEYLDSPYPPKTRQR